MVGVEFTVYELARRLIHILSYCQASLDVLLSCFYSNSVRLCTSSRLLGIISILGRLVELNNLEMNEVNERKDLEKKFLFPPVKIEMLSSISCGF